VRLRPLFAGPLAAVFCLLALAAPGRAAAAETPQWMTYDAAAKRVTMTVTAGENPSVNGGWNFNGYASGNMTITVPLGSTVDIAFKNADQLQHSLVVINGEAPLPPQGGDPAFPRAYTVSLVEGIRPGGSDQVRFTADKAGKYRIFCGVAGHGLAGMWNWLVVSAEAQGPSVETGPAK
jgi:sulfocyanin